MDKQITHNDRAITLLSTDNVGRTVGIDPAGGITVNNTNVSSEFSKRTKIAKTFNIVKGQFSTLVLRPTALNEHVSTGIVGSIPVTTITSLNAAVQIFKASADNINGILLSLSSTGGLTIDSFDTYANNTELQAVWDAADTEAVLDTGIFYDGTQSMKLDAALDTSVWTKTISSTDLTDFNFVLRLFQTHAAVEVEFFIGDGTNTKYWPLSIDYPDTWTRFEMPEKAGTEDSGTTTVASITKIGLRISGKRNGEFVYVDKMFANPSGGSVDLELWDMGDTLPILGTTTLDDGTKYEYIGDDFYQAATASKVTIALTGGKRVYDVHELICGVAKERPDNKPLTIDNYYALVLKYVDTDVNAFGLDPALEIKRYSNGFAANSAGDSSALTSINAYADLIFGIFSTVKAYICCAELNMDAVPGTNATQFIYIIDDEGKVPNILLPTTYAIQSFVDENSHIRLTEIEEGGKFTAQYGDDYTDSVIQAELKLDYLYKPVIVHG